MGLTKIADAPSAYAQEKPTHYIAKIDAKGGLVLELASKQRSRKSFGMIRKSKGYIVTNPTGKLDGYYIPYIHKAPGDASKIFTKGYASKQAPVPVDFWRSQTPIGGTVAAKQTDEEKVEKYLQDMANVARNKICALDKRPQKITLSRSVSVSFGVVGQFSIAMEYDTDELCRS